MYKNWCKVFRIFTRAPHTHTNTLHLLFNSLGAIKLCLFHSGHISKPSVKRTELDVTTLNAVKFIPVG